MKRIQLPIGVTLLAIGCEAEELVRATIEPKKERSGQFVMHITNVFKETVRFLDVREGTGGCGDFYEVTVEKGGQRYESRGNCRYAPGDDPRIVELATGQTYDRDIQPQAYVRSEKHFVPPCEVAVTYRLSDKIKKQWADMGEKVNLELTFQTPKIAIQASNK